MKAFAFLLLFSFATNAVAEPKFGPEIEFLGARHVPALICTPLYTVGLMAGVASLPFTAGWFFFEARQNGSRSEDDSERRDHAKYGLASSTGLLAAGAICIVSSHLNGDAGSRRYLARLRADLEKDAARGLVKVEEVAEGNQSWRKAVMATYPDGTKIIFGKDPAAVEVKLSPITSAEMDKRIDFLDRELYARARAVGLRVPRADGPWNGGHLHVDIAGAFGGDPRRLRNFIFDFIEHGELADGVLVKDAISARPITVKKRAQTLAAFGAHMDNLAAAGKKLTPLEIYYLAEGFPTLFAKGLALNINPQFGTLEIRSLRSQADAGTLARVMRLFDARIKHTNSLPPLPVPTVDHVGLAPTAKAARYREYVEGAGLRYEEYRGLAAPRFREGGCAVKFGWFGR